MKHIIILLLVLLFASCGKKDVYEFEKSTSQKMKASYYKEKRDGEIIDFGKMSFREWLHDDELHDLIKSTWDEFRVNAWVHFKFTPIDQDGFCFVALNKGHTSQDVSKNNMYEYGTDLGTFIVGGMREVKFYDKESNLLFTYPFEDAYEEHSDNYDVQFKTKLITRSLLDRVDPEKIQMSIYHRFRPRKGIKVQRISSLDDLKLSK